MKILKLKSIFFSLMAITMVTVFLSSCEKTTDTNSVDKDLTNVEESSNLVLDENAIIYTLPQKYNDLSEEELDVFLSNISDEELQELQVPITANEIDMRGCGGWTYQGTRCRNSATCSPKKGEFKAYRKWCWTYTPFGSIPHWYWSYEDRQGCCP